MLDLTREPGLVLRIARPILPDFQLGKRSLLNLELKRDFRLHKSDLNLFLDWHKTLALKGVIRQQQACSVFLLCVEQIRVLGEGNLAMVGHRDRPARREQARQVQERRFATQRQWVEQQIDLCMSVGFA